MNCPRCGQNISEHKANRCLDAWISEAVIGVEVRITDGAVGESFPVVPDEHGSYYAGHAKCLESPAPFYSTSIADAWKVVNKLNMSGYIVEIINDCIAWNVMFMNIDTDKKFRSDWKQSLELQICRAALKCHLSNS